MLVTQFHDKINETFKFYLRILSEKKNMEKTSSDELPDLTAQNKKPDRKQIVNMDSAEIKEIKLTLTVLSVRMDIREKV
jgi:hypothetical protein